MHRRFTHIAMLGAIVFFFSCKNMPTQTHGPIVLGDSSVIVTETDPQKLQDLVTDLKPTIQAAKLKTPRWLFLIMLRLPKRPTP